MVDLKKQVGQRLREFRNVKGYSIEELAHLAGMNAVHLATLERGEKNITLSTLEKVVTALDISFTDVFSFDDTIEPIDLPIIGKVSALMKTLTTEEQEYIYQSTLFLSRKK